MRLAGKVALVTGAARRRGIGRGIVEALAAEGAAVAINDVGAEDEAAELVEQLERQGATARFYRADVTGRDAVMGWQTDHRLNSPYPLRHNGSTTTIVQMIFQASSNRSAGSSCNG